MSLKGNRITAKANRTTSTPRRATAAKATNEPLLPLWRRTRETYTQFARVDTLDDELRAPLRRHHPPAPAEILIEFATGLKVPAPDFDLRRYADETKQKFGARSAEYRTACHRVNFCEEWKKACRAVDEKQGALKYEKERDAAQRAFDSAFAAFDKVKPTTTLGLFLTLLHGDECDNFADEHPAAVDAIIGQLQAANVPLRSLAKAKKGGAK
jgi:hypothetical protein